MWKNLKVTGLAGALVAIAMTPLVADEQFAATTIVSLPNAEILSAFDISWVDKTSHTLAVAASRVTGSGGNTGEIVIVDTQKNIVTKELRADPPFAGACSFPGRNTISGPNGVITIEKGSNADVWAGDGPVIKQTSIPKLCVPVNPPNPTPADIQEPSSVKVLDLKTGATKAVISTGGIGRADELCYNPISDVVLIANDETFDNFITFIDENSYKVLQKIKFDGTDPNGAHILANGIEQCVFNPRDGKFYMNIPATGPTGASRGVTLRISAEAPFHVEAIFDFSKPPLSSTGCTGGAGLAVGPDHQLALSCGLIIDDRTGDPVNGGVLLSEGSADEIWYNPGDNHYFFADTGTVKLGVIDAGPTPSADLTAPTATGSHSVAADPIKNQVYVPIRGNSGVPGANSTLCGSVKDVQGNPGNNAFGCIAVYTAPSDEDDCRVQGAPGQPLGGRCHSKQ
jgi:DNA-binding beta-propeller fold protein YncE